MVTDDLDRQAGELHEALTELLRVYLDRDRDRICCHDVSVTQCHALEALLRRDRLTLNELAAELCLDKSTASRVVGALERKGYVARGAHPSDGRSIVLAVSPAGRRLHARIRAGLVAERREILAAFPPSVREAAPALIRRLADGARDRARDGVGARAVPPPSLRQGPNAQTVAPGSRLAPEPLGAATNARGGGEGGA